MKGSPSIAEVKPSQDHLKKFHWEPQPAAQKLVDDLLQGFLALCPEAQTLARRMSLETATRLKDWIDHIHLGDSPEMRQRLSSVGYVSTPVPGAPGNFTHPGAILPAIVLDSKNSTLRVAIKVDSVADFLAAHGLTSEVLGDPLSQLRMAAAYRAGTAELWAVERHGTRSHEIRPSDPARSIAAMRHLEAFCRRPRDIADDHVALKFLDRLVDAAVLDLGSDWACDLFFEAERRYWMRRNTAARIQHARQNKLGLGWANHDHHTYRCTRHNFHRVIAIWEKLGFVAREAFYAGAEAGWGAQVMEQPVTQITTFNDVDLTPEEILGDFAHEGLPEAKEEVGTVGLWVRLHGESLLDAGMHHLECQFDFHALVAQLEAANVKTMDPFTTFPFLRQAFTEGERWSVEPRRIEALLAKGYITKGQADAFRRDGAIGSHLENLERNDGYKGFNQQGVSDIIQRTDPRAHSDHGFTGA